MTGSNAAPENLASLSNTLRLRIIETSSRSRTPHLGSCLSCADILATLYDAVLRIDPSRPEDPARDRFILSKGHAAPALFQILGMKGFFDPALLADYGADGGYFAEHPPTPGHVPGVEAATGSLGHGLPLSVGMAIAARHEGRGSRVYALLGDGECNEGSVWEAAMFAASQRLGRLCVIVDFNKWQATGRSREIMALDPLADKWRAFGWASEEIDGHNHHALSDAFERFSAQPDRAAPTAIVAHTVKGAGVSFMEDDNNWHYRIPTEEEVDKAAQELGVAR